MHMIIINQFQIIRNIGNTNIGYIYVSLHLANP